VDGTILAHTINGEILLPDHGYPARVIQHTQGLDTLQVRLQYYPGERELIARAPEERGNSQPDSVPYNEQGYLQNAAVARPVVVRT
jgi:hypothetical protein